MKFKHLFLISFLFLTNRLKPMNKPVKPAPKKVYSMDELLLIFKNIESDSKKKEPKKSKGIDKFNQKFKRK